MDNRKEYYARYFECELMQANDFNLIVQFDGTLQGTFNLYPNAIPLRANEKGVCTRVEIVEGPADLTRVDINYSPFTKNETSFKPETCLVAEIPQNEYEIKKIIRQIFKYPEVEVVCKPNLTLIN